MAWEREDIPDDARLYMRVHRNLVFPDGRVRPGAFSNHGRGMSTDWSKYATPEQTRSRAVRHDPVEYAVAALPAGQVRNIPQQNVEHSPTQANRAHTDVTGEKSEKVRLGFMDICTIVIAVDASQ